MRLLWLGLINIIEFFHSSGTLKEETCMLIELLWGVSYVITPTFVFFSTGLVDLLLSRSGASADFIKVATIDPSIFFYGCWLRRNVGWVLTTLGRFMRFLRRMLFNDDLLAFSFFLMRRIDFKFSREFICYYAIVEWLIRSSGLSSNTWSSYGKSTKISTLRTSLNIRPPSVLRFLSATFLMTLERWSFVGLAAGPLP